MNKSKNSHFSPEKKKINYYEENPKLVKREKKRESFNNNKILIDSRENINEENIKINFDENMNIKTELLNFDNNFSISQPINPNNIQNNNFSMNNNILDDFLNEIENEEKEKNYLGKKDISIGEELKGSFQRNKYNNYFQTSRTQYNQFSNIWDDFHQKRDKI